MLNMYVAVYDVWGDTVLIHHFSLSIFFPAPLADLSHNYFVYLFSRLDDHLNILLFCVNTFFTIILFYYKNTTQKVKLMK